ncbi:DUF3127 domain-containing protein [Parahaliea mediterranea]|uniref:DUF3127 domain-containing protein n=1 Tax=Parahaliea mediterranea TaxID=651086 RepID=A0A939DEJ6_9GAMM|nr:DUF3127 domain-containing protein [Parahaliea mediterranea]
MSYELSGKIKLIQEPQTFNSGFTKREMVVIVEDGKYPQEINLEFVQDKVSLLDSLQPGQEVKVNFDIRGREYNGRYFNNLQGWRVEVLGGAAAAPSAPAGFGGEEPPPYSDDDIPF